MVMQKTYQSDQSTSLAGFTQASPATPRALAPRSTQPGAGTQPSASAPAHGGPSREVFAFSYAGSLDDTVNTPPQFGYRLWDLSLISTVGYFGVGVNADGSLDRTSTGWKVMQTSQFQSFMNAAHGSGTRVVLTIVLQDFSNLTPTMCSGLANRFKTIGETVSAVRAYGFDGVNVDYEGEGGSCAGGRPQDMLIDMMYNLRISLNGSAPASNYVSIDTYGGSADDQSGLGFFIIPRLNPWVDAFFVMSYDMEYSNWRAAGCTSFCLGPTAPLTGYTYNDTGEMASYIATVPAAKVILGVPYYGRKACVASPTPNAKPIQKPSSPSAPWVDADRYVDAVYDAYQQALPVAHHTDANDPAGADPWETWHSNSYGCDRELYWDNTTSLGLKYDLVNRDQLRGVGLWTINYGEAPELWDTLRSHFTNAPVQTAVQNQSYHLDSANDGGMESWVEIDPGLRINEVPTADGTAVATASIDLWTAVAGYNQDAAIFVSTDSGPDVLLAWKESGGVGGSYSPNPAFVQAVTPARAGHSYLFKLKWKPNRAAPGGTIFAGAGSIDTQFSPTRLTVRMLPSPSLTSAVRRTSYHLDTANDGGFTSWVPVDPSLDVVVPGTDATVQVSANLDLWTARAGYNGDVGLFVLDSGNPAAGDVQLAWTENGFAATFSPSAAFVTTTFDTHAGHNYTFRLKWKPNRQAPPGTIYAGAGTALTEFSPTRLTVEQMVAGSFQSATQKVSYHLDAPNAGNFQSWVELNPQNRVVVNPSAAYQAIVTGGIDLWSTAPGYNGDIAVFACDAALADCSPFTNFALVAWKESGNPAAYAPNAATVQTVMPLTAGHAYTFALGWKPNRPTPGGVIYGAAGMAGTEFSPTTLLVQLAR